MALAKTLELQKVPTWAKNTTLVIGSSLLIGLFAHVAIPLPFTPVPIVTQASLVLLLSVLLGSKRAVAAVMLFLLQGAAGLPVFANGGSIERFVGPTAGYLAGYLVAAYVVGKIVEISGKRALLTAALAMFAGKVILFILGAAWLSTFVGSHNALMQGVVPFIIPGLVKIAICVKILQWVRWDKR